MTTPPTMSQFADKLSCLEARDKYWQEENAKLREQLGDGTTGNKYRAELYDELWRSAKSMGFANVTDALGEIVKLREQLAEQQAVLWKRYPTANETRNACKELNTLLALAEHRGYDRCVASSNTLLAQAREEGVAQGIKFGVNMTIDTTAVADEKNSILRAVVDSLANLNAAAPKPE